MVLILSFLDLVSLPNFHNFIHKEEVSKIKSIKKLHSGVRSQIQQQTKRYKNKTIRGRWKLYLRKGIEFSFTCRKTNFINKGSLNSTPRVMVPSKSSRE